MTSKKLILAALAAAPVAIAFAAPAQAQVAGIASANPTDVVAQTKAYAAANQQIQTTYKTTFDQIRARRDALQKEVEPMLAQLDTNKDKKLDDAEIKAAQDSKNPVLDRLRTAQTKADEEINNLTKPVARAELFAVESILRQYEAAQLRVVNAKKVSVVLSPEVFMYAPDSVDISTAIAQEIDKVAPTVAITAPADWQPARQTIAIQQQLVQLNQLRAYQAAMQQQQGAAAAPAAGAKPAAGKQAEPR